MKSEGNTGTYVAGSQGLPLPMYGTTRKSTPSRPRPTGLDWNATRPAGETAAAASTGPRNKACRGCGNATPVDELRDRYCPVCTASLEERFHQEDAQLGRELAALEETIDHRPPEPAPAPPSLSERVAKRLEDNADQLGQSIRNRTRRHATATTCPRCDAQLGTIGLPDLAYTFEVCTCRQDVSYDHLIEQLWHRPCLAAHIVDAALQAPHPRPHAAPVAPSPTRAPRSRTRRRTDLDVEDVVRRYHAGETSPAIATALGVTPKRIRLTLDEAGVARRDDRAGHSGSRKKSAADDDPALVDTVRRLYLEEQLTLEEVGEHVGLSQKGVQGLAERHSIPIRPAAAFGPRNNASKITAEQRTEIARRYQAGESLSQLAAAFEVSSPTIVNHLDACGVSRRPKGGTRSEVARG